MLRDFAEERMAVGGAGGGAEGRTGRDPALTVGGSWGGMSLGLVAGGGATATNPNFDFDEDEAGDGLLLEDGRDEG